MSNDSTIKYDDNCEKVVMLFGVNIAKNSTKDDDTLKDSCNNSIENNNYEISIFEDRNDVVNDYDNKQLSEFDAGQSSNHANMRMKKVKQWTRKEHKAFLKGLKAVGKGKWKHISKKYVMTKTHTQVASHAQKYFNRSETDPKLHKNMGRQSIFDIKLHDDCEYSKASGEFLSSLELEHVYENDNDNDNYNDKFPELHIGQSSNGDKIKKVKPWTLEEHRAFLKGLEAVGRGKWKLISKKFVMTRTPTQVASHAQKYFIRLETDPKLYKKKGHSIFDTKLHDEYEREDILRQLSLRVSPIKLLAFDECRRSANIKQSTVQRQLFRKED